MTAEIFKFPAPRQQSAARSRVLLAALDEAEAFRKLQAAQAVFDRDPGPSNSAELGAARARWAGCFEDRCNG